jgi:OOP family OmpA-OmpF porin
MTAWREWLVPGLVVTFCLAVAAWLFEGGRVEDALAARVAEVLRAEGHDWVEVAASGRAALIDGTADSDAERVVALQTAARVAGVRGVVDTTALLPAAIPFVWIAELGDGSVRLTGARPPGEEARLRIVQALAERLPGIRIDDRSAPARGAAPAFLSAADHAVDVLTLLAEGRVELADDALTVSGLAVDSAAFDGANALIAGAMPAGFRLAAMSIAPPLADPFWLEATVAPGEILVTGTVASTEMREALRAEATALWDGRLNLTERTTLASGAPPEFAEAAGFALRQAARLAEGRVRLVDLALDLEGVAASLEDFDALAVLSESPMPSGVSVADSRVLPAVASPYFWSAERIGGDLVLGGYMPTPEAKSELLSAATTILPGLAIRDDLRVAGGAPQMDWIGAAEFALRQLARLGKGTVMVAEHALSVTGAAADAAAIGEFETLRSGTLPASLRLERLDIDPPIVSPYRVTLMKDADGVTIDGFVPDEAARELLLAEAGERFAAAAVTERVELASGAPEDLALAIEAALDALTRLEAGRAEIIDRVIHLEGDVPFPAAAALVARNVAAAAGPGFMVNEALVAAPLGEALTTAHCQSAVNGVLATTQVQFPAGETSILSESYGLLDRAVAVLLRCPSALVEVGGHTDADGAASYNRSVSLARAESVVAYLTEAGIGPDRLSAMGYGESRPVAGNETPEDKARNRRIEFTLRDP